MATPRAVSQDFLLPLSNIEAGLCGPDGIEVFQGPQYYKYEGIKILTMSRIAPQPLPISSGVMGCQE